MTGVNHIPDCGKKHTLGLISNPLSGWNKKGMQVVRESVNGYPQICHREASTPSEMALALAEFAFKKIDVIAVNGGDGTIHAVLTELFRQSNGGPIPLLMILYPNIVLRSILKVETASGQEPLYGMFFGAAGICQGIQFCLDRVHTKGLGGELAAGLTLARFLIPAGNKKNNFIFPVPVKIAFNNEPEEERDVLSILISTLDRLFLGFRPYLGTENAPLHYTELGAHPRRLMRILPSLLRGRKHRFLTPKNGYLSRDIHKAEFVFTGSFAIDGELYTPDNQAERITVSKGGTASFLRV